jgi:outer membrane protein insertion porin family
MRCRYAPLILWGATMLATCGASAQTWSPSQITFTGTDLSQGELLAFTGLKTGEPVTREQMQAATDKLTASGLFSGGRFSFDGETLTFELTPSQAVVPVEYDNFPWWDDKTLNAAVATRVPLFHGSLNPGGAMRDEVSAALESILATKGVQAAAITTSPVGGPLGNQVAILYHIDSPPVVLEGFRVYDYSGVWTRPIEEVEKAAAGQKFEGGIRNTLTDEIRAVYGHLGFIDMKMTTPAWGQPRIAGGKILVPITASITSEGVQYRVSAIHLQGDILMTEDQFAQRAALHPGDVADQDAWKPIREMLTASYRTHGYLDATTNVTPKLDRTNHTVDYTITVDPGPVYRMGKLTLANLDQKQQAELMPYWLLRPGDVFNPDLIPKSVADYHQARAEDLQSIHTGFDAHWAANHDTHTVDVMLTFDAPHR